MSRRDHFLSIIALLLVLPALGSAQVALTVGVEEIYDQNIYLENDNARLDLPADLDPADAEALKPYNGDPDDDFITNVYLAASGSIPLTKYLKTAAEGRLGTMFFADNSDEDRLTLDSLIDVTSEESLLPKPWFFKLTSDFSSQSADISVSDGATAKQSESHLASLDLGVKRWQYSQQPALDLSLYYRFQRMDYLDIFDFGDSALLNEDGADYFSNGALNEFGYDYSETLRFVWTSTADYYSYTSVTDDDEFSDIDQDDLDRLAYDSRVGFKYQAREDLVLAANIGVEGAHYPDRQSSEIITLDDGITTVAADDDDDELSLAYDASASYLIDPTSSLNVLFEQTTGNNINGASISYRNLSAFLTKGLTDTLSLSTGGRFIQFDDGDTISDATDRYEATVALNYALTEALSLSAGWNYVNQNASDEDTSSFVASDDYESHRAFLGISAGVIGTK